MTTEPTYSIVERDHDGFVVNIIEGLVRARAELIADSLRIGTAYTGERPRTCEIEREPTPVEKVEAVVDKWLAEGSSLTRVDHMAACLRRVADQLDQLGAMEIPGCGLKVELHLFSTHAPAQQRMAALDEMAAVVLDRKAQMGEQGHYGTGHIYGSGVRMVTIVEPEPKPEPKPLVISDETIQQAKWIGARYPDGVNFVEPEHKREPGDTAECMCGEVFDDKAALDRHIDSHPIGASS